MIQNNAVLSRDRGPSASVAYMTVSLFLISATSFSPLATGSYLHCRSVNNHLCSHHHITGPYSHLVCVIIVQMYVRTFGTSLLPSHFFTYVLSKEITLFQVLCQLTRQKQFVPDRRNSTRCVNPLR